MVKLPLLVHVMVIELVVEEPEHPAGRVHAKVNVPVPPDAVAMQLNGLPAVAVPQDTETVGGVPTGAAQGPVTAVEVSTAMHMWLGWLLRITAPRRSRTEPVLNWLSTT